MRTTRTLNVEACLSMYRGKTLKEIIEDTNNPSSRIGALCDSPDFWRAVIDKFYEPWFLKSRKDIDSQDFKLLAENLSIGRSLYYSVLINLNPPESKAINPVLVNSLDDESLIRQNMLDDDVINFEVFGLEPVPGSKGYVFTYRVSRPDRVRDTVESLYFLGKASDSWEGIATNLKTHIAQKVLEDLDELALPGDVVVLMSSGRAPYQWTQGHIVDPMVFLNIPINANASLLTEIYVYVDDERDLHIQLWVAQIEF